MPFIARVGRPGLLGTAVRTAVVAGTAQAAAGAVARRQQERAYASREAHQQQAALLQQQLQSPAGQTAAETQAVAGPSTDGFIAELERLAALKDAGLLTDSEFAAAKAKLLG